jgi:predicted lipoprotein with Yx(FWY)xxD motif
MGVNRARPGMDYERGYQMKKLSILAALAGLALLAACASGDAGPAKVGDTGMGKVLTDSKGMTLYTFDRDATGKSNCNGQCAQNWPPLMASADAKSMGDWTVVTRDDGSKMWAYKGKPVYTWVRDTKPGDTTGDGFANNVWHVAKP